MSREGRDLELLVALLEKSLAPEGIAIESPGFIPDRVTGSLREVDVAIRWNIGSVPILIIVECRDRNAAQDVTWIEQLAQKRNDLNASRAVAVSPNGFSKDARAKAEHEGIELREFSELSQEEVQSWCKVGEISCFTRRALLSHISVELDSKTVDDSVAVPDDLKQRLAKLDLGDKLFIAKGRGELQSVQTIWRNLVGTEPVFDGAPQDGRHVPRRFKIQYPNESDRFLLEPMPARPEVAAIVVEAELWLERTQVPISRIHQYVSDDGAHVETVEYYVEAKNARRVVSLHRLVESGELAVTVRRLEDPR